MEAENIRTIDWTAQRRARVEASLRKVRMWCHREFVNARLIAGPMRTDWTSQDLYLEPPRSGEPVQRSLVGRPAAIYQALLDVEVTTNEVLGFREHAINVLTSFVATCDQITALLKDDEHGLLAGAGALWMGTSAESWGPDRHARQVRGGQVLAALLRLYAIGHARRGAHALVHHFAQQRPCEFELYLRGGDGSERHFALRLQQLGFKRADIAEITSASGKTASEDGERDVMADRTRYRLRSARRRTGSKGASSRIRVAPYRHLAVMLVSKHAEPNESFAVAVRGRGAVPSIDRQRSPLDT